MKPPATQPLLGQPSTLLISTFTSLLAYDLRRSSWSIVHEGQGKYFGSIVVDPRRLAVVSRPDGEANNDLLIFDRATGSLVEEVSLPSSDTHQIRRFGDALYVTDTARGRLVRIQLGADSALGHQTVDATFTVEDHLNSVYVEDRHVDVLLHSFGPSSVVRFDRATQRQLARVDGVGRNSHDLEPYNDALLVCGSADGTLLRVDVTNRSVETMWERATTFTKGLAVVDHRAYVGCSAPSTRRDRWTLPTDIVVVDLPTRRAIDTIRVPQLGLVNAIAPIGRLDADAFGTSPVTPGPVEIKGPGP